MIRGARNGRTYSLFTSKLATEIVFALGFDVQYYSVMMFKVLFILISLWHCSATLKILVALPATFRSHYQFGAAISKALAAKGHEVTVVSPFEQSKPLPPNYKEVFLELTQDAVSACNSFYRKS